MSGENKPSLRIDWFDGSVVEEIRPSSSAPSGFEDEDVAEPHTVSKPTYTERKLMGYKRLLFLSDQTAQALALQLSEKSSFWDLLNSELNDDYIVLIAKILGKLYQYLKSGNKSILLSNLLKRKFLPSQFLNTLESYINKLPDVRIVNKRTNSRLWDDVEAFFTDVLDLCDGIYSLAYDDMDPKLLCLLEITRASIIGIIEEHKEQFTPELFDYLEDLESRIGASKKNQEQTLKKNQDPNHFKNLSIFPNKNDLLGKTPFIIEPNIVNGAYSSVEHYLDIQFKLLREDCFGPLREGISKYMENPSRRRHENIRVHPKVRIIRTYVSNNKVGHLVDMAWMERRTQGSADRKHLAFNKQLMFGSLLLFTSDNFENILCATVLDSNMHLLNEGYIAVSFHTPVSNKIFSESYLLIESEVFFEPYHRVMKVLQNSDIDRLPMQQYIVNVQPKTNPPSYLTSETKYSVLKEKEEITFSVLNPESWPPEHAFGLDQSQMQAYNLALTREFAVIQGPPGTGKTFMGVKLGRTLLQNLSLEGTPMLIICYTNHALDQFLEGILATTTNILRLGSQSKNKKIEPYALHNLRTKTKSRFTHLYASKRIEQENIYKQMMNMQTEIEKCEKQLVSYKSLKGHLKVNDGDIVLKSTKEEPILQWLFSDTDSDIINEESDWENNFSDGDENIPVKSVETCFSEEWALKEIESMQKSIKYVADVTESESERDKMVEKFARHMEKIRKRLYYFKKYLKMSEDPDFKKTINHNDPYSLEIDERWFLYFQAVSGLKRQLSLNMDELQAKYNVSSQELEEISTLVDADLIKTARVVGVTTTTAARRHDLLQALKSPIVIIEEAAEVLEAHIVASLTFHCQHVILIGDHKQLRPTAAHYVLAKNYNFEISLFERMINNGIHARTLTTQRRMRPEFVKLLTPTIYETLENHPGVYDYKDVNGMTRNLFFLTHSVLEDEGFDDSWSHKNTHEAKWCVALAFYLRLKNYKSEDITILATYTGQANLIKELMKNQTSLNNIKVTVVDNYQGEENRIVILSLVRSNSDNKIGFLNAQNRVCVALSRAKEGFYIFGNMDVLKTASSLWRSINSILESGYNIGNSLPVRCDQHKENTMNIQTSEELQNCVSRQCLKVCQMK